MLRWLRGFVLIVLAGLAGAGTARADAPVGALRATATRLAGDLRRTRLVIDLSGPVAFHAFLLADPARVVVDLPEIAFALPPQTGGEGRGLVSAFRFGSVGPGRSRVVMDLAQPCAIDKAFLIPSGDDQPARLVVDLVRTDRAAFDRAVAAGRQIEPPAALKADRLAPSPAAGPDALPTVVIDPGHGGIDAGAKSPSGQQEKGIVLAFARALRDRLAAGGHYRVVMTRDADTYVTLTDRVRIAREAHAALLVSIHADTLPDPFGVRGATIYTLSDTASDAATASYADKENRADQNAGVDATAAADDDVSDILFELTRRETRTFSNQFAKVLATDFAQAATLNKNPHRSAGFKVLTAPDVPSVLLELGYLSNAQDLKLLASDEWVAGASTAVAGAVDAFFALHGKVTPSASPSPSMARRPGADPDELAAGGLTVVRAAVSP